MTGNLDASNVVLPVIPQMIGLGEELTIKSSLKTTGGYICTATSQGFPPLSATIQLRLRGPPKITAASPVWVGEGQRATLSCEVRAVPHPVAMTWFKGGTALTTG